MTEATQSETPAQLGALDLGSNSFHLLVAQEVAGRIQVLDKYKEMVRLADGLDENNVIDEKTLDRALNCLERLGQRLQSLRPEHVRIVGTNTLRKAANADSFIQQAEALLGHKIEIVSGREEARLIFVGVCHDLGIAEKARLVVDIGGGSTELIVGKETQAVELESLHMGCVSMSKKHFPDGQITDKAMQNAIRAALVELEPVVGEFSAQRWENAVGASGSINAIAEVVRQSYGRSQFNRGDLQELVNRTLSAGHIDKLDFSGLAAERKPVFAGGLAILVAVFDALNISHMTPAQGALREGIIYDLLGRQQSADARDDTVMQLQQRYRVDTTQANRVKATALTLLDQVAPAWQIQSSDSKQLLGWAADVHEIGMDVSHSGFHKHGAYLLEHMDMPGFSRTEQQQLAMLVATHRRKLTKSPFVDATSELQKLALVLRLAVLLHRNRSNVPGIPLFIQAHEQKVTLHIGEAWLRKNPLTVDDLNNEKSYLQASPYSLKVETTTSLGDETVADEPLGAPANSS